MMMIVYILSLATEGRTSPSEPLMLRELNLARPGSLKWLAGEPEESQLGPLQSCGS